MGILNAAITASKASLSSSANLEALDIVVIAFDMIVSATTHPSFHFSFPSVRSQTITARADAWPRATAAAVPPPGVGDEDARAL